MKRLSAPTPPHCVFHATLSSGVFKGDSYVCDAPAVGDYYDPLYKSRRPVCRLHAGVVNRRAAKLKLEGVTFYPPRREGE